MRILKGKPIKNTATIVDIFLHKKPTISYRFITLSLTFLLMIYKIN